MFNIIIHTTINHLYTQVRHASDNLISWYICHYSLDVTEFKRLHESLNWSLSTISKHAICMYREIVVPSNIESLMTSARLTFLRWRLRENYPLCQLTNTCYVRRSWNNVASTKRLSPFLCIPLFYVTFCRDCPSAFCSASAQSYWITQPMPPLKGLMINELCAAVKLLTRASSLYEREIPLR